jgi:hypothetical protein
MDASSVNADQLLGSLERLTLSNSEAVLRFGARFVVLCKFVDAVLPQLSVRQRQRIVPLFRQGVEDVMSRTDDIIVPVTYYATLLEQTNILLDALEKKVRDVR